MSRPKISITQRHHLRQFAEQLQSVRSEQRNKAFLLQAIGLVGATGALVVDGTNAKQDRPHSIGGWATLREQQALALLLVNRFRQWPVASARLGPFSRMDFVDDHAWRQRTLPLVDFFVVRLPRAQQRFSLLIVLQTRRRFTRMDRELFSLLFIESARALGAPEIDKSFPPRLLRTLRLLQEGLSMAKVANRLKLSVHTVNDYRKELYERFSVHSRSELLSSPAVLSKARPLEGNATKGSPTLSVWSATTLHLLCSGFSEKEIAKELSCSVHTVHTRTRALYRIFGISRRAELIRAYYALPSTERSSLGLEGSSLPRNKPARQ